MTKRNGAKFQIGDLVKCSSLKKTGQIVEGPNQRGEYLLECGSIKIWEAEDSLSAAKPRKQQATKGALKKAKCGKRVAAITLDLHGLKGDQAIEKVSIAINKALLEDVSRIEVIHGIGTGALKAAIYDYLKTAPGIQHFRPDESNQGVVWVYL